MAATEGNTLAAALEYVDRGWHVLPCQHRGKEPLYDLVPHAALDSSNDPEIVRAWFGRYPNANLAVRCGSISGIVVLDVDPRHGGSDALSRLIAEHGALPDTVTCMTGGEGVHFYFRHPGIPLETWKDSGLELRIENVYVVAPPSVHPSGLDYRWSLPPSGQPLADLPEWLRRPKRERPRLGLSVPSRSSEEVWANAALEAEVSDLAACPSGNRNNRLNEAAFNLGQIVGSGFLARVVVENRLLDAAASNGSLADDGEGKTRGTIRSGLDAGLKEPRYPKASVSSTPRPAPAAVTATPAVETHEIPPVTYMDLDAEPPPVEWIVQHWLARGDIGIVAAGPFSGKSTLLADLAVAISHERPWVSSLDVVRTGPAIYFDEEQSLGTTLRLFRGLGARPGHNLHVASAQGMVISSAEGQVRLRREIERIQPVLVVLDTVAQVFAGISLSKMEEVSPVFRYLMNLRNEHGTAFLLNTHNRKSARDGRMATDPLEEMFGSIAFSGAVDTMWPAKRDGNALEVVQRKRRDREGDLQTMRVAYEKSPAGRITLASEGPIKLASTIQGRAEIAMVELALSRAFVTTAELHASGGAIGAKETTSKGALEQLVKTGRLVKISRGKYCVSERAKEQVFEQTDILSPPNDRPFSDRPNSDL